MRTVSGLSGCTRRWVLTFLTAAPLHAEAGKGRWYPSDGKQVIDPATEFPLLRLTDPAYSSRLPAGRLRSIARSGSFLLFSSDRAGSLQVFRLDVSTGGRQQLTAALELDSSTPALMPDDQSFCYWDGEALRRVSLKNLREKEICRVSPGWRRVEGFSLARDGSYAAWVETAERQYRLRVARVSSGHTVTVAEGVDPLGDPALHSRREGVLYRDGGGGLVLAGLDGRGRRRLPLPESDLGYYVWAPDGKSVFYLHSPGGRGASVLREHRLDTEADQLVAATSSWRFFSANGDATVFVGASGSLAAPYILLLVRAGGRERALCEHRASEPSRTSCVFAPDSQRVYFQTDREGQWTIYGVPVDRLVEPTPAKRAKM
jgi:oligogalacturonide lyase